MYYTIYHPLWKSAFSHTYLLGACSPNTDVDVLTLHWKIDTRMKAAALYYVQLCIVCIGK